MAEHPLIPPKNSDLVVKLQNEQDYAARIPILAERRSSLFDVDQYYDCLEQVENLEIQRANEGTYFRNLVEADFFSATSIIPVTPSESASINTEMLSDSHNASNRIQLTGPEEDVASATSEEKEQKAGRKPKGLDNPYDEQALSEVLKNLQDFGEEIRKYASRGAEDIDNAVPECTGTEPCLEPFVTDSDELEPKANGDFGEGISAEMLQDEHLISDHSNSAFNNEVENLSVPFLCGAPPAEVWCSLHLVKVPSQPNVPVNTIRNLFLDNLQEYFRRLPGGMSWVENEDKERNQDPETENEDHQGLKKRNTAPDMPLTNSQEQKLEDEGIEEEDDTDFYDTDDDDSSSEWSTTSCHTVGSDSDFDNDDDEEESSEYAEDSLNGVYEDDNIEEIDERPADCGDGNSRISIPAEELDEGIYEYEDDDSIYLSAEYGDQASLVDNAVFYNINLVSEDNEGSRRRPLPTDRMLDELFSTARLTPRPVRIFQGLQDHLHSEETAGGGEGDYELGRQMVVQNFFVEDRETELEESIGSLWTSPAEYDVNDGLVQDFLRWTTFAGFCLSAFLIWEFHHCLR